jgi:MSHA biogenesis protein MshJ
MIPARVKVLLQKIDSLTLRERLLLFAGAVAVIAGLWQALLMGPLEARERIASAEVANLRQNLEQLNQSMSLTAEGIGDGVPGKLQRLEILKRQVDETGESVRVFTTDLVNPTQMRVVLEDLIRRQDGLELISMSNLAVEPLIEDQEPQAGEDEPRLYRHGMVLLLEGPYLQCLQYLQAVERLPWQLYWARLELENEAYPRNRILIELHTLSLQEDWIGV